MLMQNAEWTCFQAGWTGRRHDNMYRHIIPSSFRRRGNAMAERFDRIWHNARLASVRGDLPDLGMIEDGVIAACDGRIAFAGSRSDFPSEADAAERIDCAGRWITPGLVDCHTHLVFGGNRAHEFELRLQGASYEEIARAGGGIVSTVAATRASSEAELVAGALPRLDALIGEGVTTLEIKSGYGLNTETEMRQLSAARALGRDRPVSIRTTFLGAHALPPEADGDKDRYIDLVCREMLPSVAQAGLAARGRRLHGRHRVLGRANGAGVPRGKGAGITRQTARRSIVEPRRSSAGFGIFGSVRRSSGTHRCGWRRSHGAGKYGGCAAAGRILFHSRNEEASDRTVSRPRRAHGARNRLQPGQLAADVAASGHEYGRDAVPDECCRMPCRRDAGSCACTGYSR